MKFRKYDNENMTLIVHNIVKASRWQNEWDVIIRYNLNKCR